MNTKLNSYPLQIKSETIMKTGFSVELEDWILLTVKLNLW